MRLRRLVANLLARWKIPDHITESQIGIQLLFKSQSPKKGIEQLIFKSQSRDTWNSAGICTSKVFKLSTKVFKLSTKVFKVVHEIRQLSILIDLKKKITLGVKICQERAGTRWSNEKETFYGGDKTILDLMFSLRMVMVTKLMLMLMLRRPVHKPCCLL